MLRAGKCMDLTGSELRREAYQVVPVHERSDHEYLVAKRDRSKKRTLEERYMRDEITLTEYNDMKDPDRRERRLAAEATYPLPEPLYTCVICGKDECAQIPCMECGNRACRDCMLDKFHGDIDRPYVLMHHIYCVYPRLAISAPRRPSDTIERPRIEGRLKLVSTQA